MSSPAPRGAIHQQIAPSVLEDQAINKKPEAKPHWLLLGAEVGCLAIILHSILDFIWSPQYLTLGDVMEYHQYALAFWTQAPLFHQFPQEYPPLSLIPFLFTLSPSSSIPYYWAFAWCMEAIFCLSYLWLARSVSHSKALVYALYLLTGTMATLLMRYDLLPALATLGALRLAERKRYAWAYAMLAAGALLKLYPAFLVPVVMAAQWRESLPARAASPDGLAQADHAPQRTSQRELWQRSKPLLKGASLFVLLVGLGFGLPLLINPLESSSVFTYNLDRPIQIESLPGSLLWFGALLGFPVRGEVSFGSLNLVGALEDPLKQLSLVGLAAGSLLVYWRVWRGRLSLGQGFVAALGLVLICNKVLSPQYFIWILPLVAYVMGFDFLWLLICIVTTVIYPFLYHIYYHLGHEITNPTLLWTIALRNILLTAAVARAVLGQSGWPRLRAAKIRQEPAAA